MNGNENTMCTFRLTARVLLDIGANIVHIIPIRNTVLEAREHVLVFDGATFLVAGIPMQPVCLSEFRPPCTRNRS